MSNLIRHPYHLVDESPWPLISSIGAFCTTVGLVKWFHTNSSSLLLCGLFIILAVIAQWWRDVAQEGAAQGLHSPIVELGLRWGMILFIVSEVFFFLSFFWAFFHRRLAPTVELGANWPPAGLVPFNAFQVPLLNTIILLSSGIRVTWAHHALMAGNHTSATQRLVLTIIIGVYFTFLQGFEYYEASFRIADSIYGASFFLATGFHGLHVLVGTSFLLVCFFRLVKHQLSARHHFGFEAAAWYWHFVDVVWLFLFVSIYWWGGAFSYNIIIIVYLQ